MKSKIYLDNASTTKCDSKVFEKMLPYLKNDFGNASSHHQFGQIAKNAIEKSREKIGKILNAEPYEIVFTSGGTEAINHAIIGTAFYQKRAKNKDEIIVSTIEHHSVLNSAKYLQNFGFKLKFLNVDKFGKIIIDELKNNISNKTALICVMHANNEIGTIQSINEISNLIGDAILFSDTVQSIGKLKFDFQNFPAHLSSISSHKINGPKGIGALLIKKGVELDPIIHGGSQERNHRGGTENVASIVGLASALEFWDKNQKKYFDKFIKQKNILKNKLIKNKKIIFNGDLENSLPNILSVSINDEKNKIDGEMFLINLDLNGVAISSGSACSSGSIQPSHVLKAIGRDDKVASKTFRFSFGKDTKTAEVMKAGEIFLRLLKKYNI